jgi:hypothetical protein
VIRQSSTVATTLTRFPNSFCVFSAAYSSALNCRITGKPLDWQHFRGWLSSFADIDHAVKIAGINHEGIRSDFDGIAVAANVVEDVSKMPALVAVLLKRGYTEGDMKKFLGENHLAPLFERRRHAGQGFRAPPTLIDLLGNGESIIRAFFSSTSHSTTVSEFAIELRTLA